MNHKKTATKATIKRNAAKKKPCKTAVRDPEFSALPSDSTAENENFSAVAINASAGGLKVFGQFFTHIPAGSGMAFLLVPSLDPTYKSILANIIKRYTNMSVLQIKDGMKVVPDNVYIIPPYKAVSILHGTLQLLRTSRSNMTSRYRPVYHAAERPEDIPGRCQEHGGPSCERRYYGNGLNMLRAKGRLKFQVVTRDLKRVTGYVFQ